ncbi:hypothetical protein WAI453_008056 [Rhynchosporium graminicola]
MDTTTPIRNSSVRLYVDSSPTSTREFRTPDAPPSPSLSDIEDSFEEESPESVEDYIPENHESSKCCLCDAYGPFTYGNYSFEWLCDKCDHERCDDCTLYDEDNYSMLSGCSDEHDYDRERRYRCYDDEADEAIAKVADPNIPHSYILEDGVDDLDFFEVAFDEFKKETRTGRQVLAPELKYQIAFEVLMPEPRVIRAIWSHSTKCLTYRAHRPANMMPFILKAFGGFLRALRFVDPAPDLGCPSYPWFQYNSDTLFIDYRRCGSRDVDAQEYVDAIKLAAKKLQVHVNAGKPVVARLRVSWCQNYENPHEILGVFRNIAGIKSINLDAHDHYHTWEDATTQYQHRNQWDPARMQKMVNNGDLVGTPPYPFTVRLFKCDGTEFVYGDKPLREEWEENDSSDDGDEDEEDGSDNGDDEDN